MALRDIYLRLAWQPWHLVTSTFHLHVKRGTCGGRVLVALLVAVSRRGTLCGRRGTWRHPPSLCVADVALGDINLHFALQAWHLVTSTFVLRGRRGHLVTSTFLLRGRRGMAVVALGWVRWRAWSPPVTPGHFVWQAWDLATSMVHWRGRRTWRHPPSLSVAGLALGDIHLQAGMELGDIHLRFRVADAGGMVGARRSPAAPRHFACTWRHPPGPTLCVAGMASTFVWRGRCCTTLSHTTRTELFHTHPSHTQLCHPQLCHTQSFTHTHISLTCNFSLTHIFVIHNFVTHNLSHTHTSLSHATSLSHTSLSHTTLSHTTFSHTTLSHTTLSHAIFHTQLCHTHTTLPHTTLSNAQLCDTQLFTYNF